jgi:hypothetical protein
MVLPNLKRLGVVCALWSCVATHVSAQVIETVGTRALGMGGAFVAVASDSTATWWNPAGLAAGPFLDIALAGAVTEAAEELPAHRDRGTWLAAATPPLGFSYYRLRITDIRPFDPTGTSSAVREDRRAEVPVHSLAISQLGITLVQTVVPGLHVGATLKYVRGTLETEELESGQTATDYLERGEDLSGGGARGTFDLDAGVLAVAGALRFGAVVRNVREPGFIAADGLEVVLPRQVRVGVAFAPDSVGGPPLTVAVDVDARTTDSASGDRRIVAVGAERWLWQRRIGVRAGARFNTVGAEDQSGTAGASVAVKSGLYVDAHVVRGGSADDRGWGIGARVSF